MGNSAVTSTAVTSTLRRHNSISAITPNKLLQSPTKPPIRTSSLDLELLLLKSPYTSYTSLKDMLSPNAAVNSPTTSSATINSGYEISIRNRLVKQAAWSYLQPMSSSVENSSAPNFLHRIFHCLSSDNLQKMWMVLRMISTFSDSSSSTMSLNKDTSGKT